MKTEIKHTYRFQSTSDPGKFYETLQYVDGTTSCNCPGWTRHVQADGSRKCRHVKEVAGGMKPTVKPNFFDTQVQLLTAQKLKGVKLAPKAVKMESPAAVLKRMGSSLKPTKPKRVQVTAPKKAPETFVLEKPRRVFNLED